MSDSLWKSVDAYVTDHLVHPDAALEAALISSAAAGLPPIAVSPAQGRFLHLLARSINAQNILEIGTLGGYSTIWLARALPPTGRLITLEIDPAHARIARENLARANLNDRVEVFLGRAVDSLAQLAAENAGPFDLTFIDADKPSTCDYFTYALKLSRPGSLIIIDNVVREGKLIDAATPDASVQGVRRLHERLAREPRVIATTLQTVGSKGYDGFTIALVTSA